MEQVDSEPFSCILNFIFLAIAPDLVGYIISGIVLIILILCSALISGSEVAFFSINKQGMQELKETGKAVDQIIIRLLRTPRNLLATILIANNVVNIAIVMLFTILSDQLFDFSQNPAIAFLVNVVTITFILVLLGEVIPKVYANQFNMNFASFMAYPMLVLSKALYPLAYVLVRFTSVVEKKMNKKGHEVSVRDLKEAIDITADDDSSLEEKKILKGLVNFGNITVKQIMTTRVEVEAYDIETPFGELIEHINENRFSRLPIYEENFDQIKGILYIKDLIPHLDHKVDFEWTQLIREAYYVPENKKIDDLLKEFQEKKVHMAIVVDEYGGTSGIITLEDILEEIVGEINDEFDDDNLHYSKLDEFTFVFDGKTSLTDFIRIVQAEEDEETFNEYLSEVESLGGLLVEILGRIPKNQETLEFGRFQFKVESADRRRVRRVKVSITEKDKASIENNE